MKILSLYVKWNEFGYNKIVNIINIIVSESILNVITIIISS